MLALGLGAGLTGCSSEPDGPAPAAGDDGPSVVQPGLPGEPSASGDDVVVPPPPPWNHADVAFVQMMIPHHAQAVEMARLAEKRAGSDQVRRLAERIRAAQAPEILLMAAWLEEQGVDVPSASEDPLDYDHRAHSHDGMAGMLSPAEMDRLADARGRRFDRLFLRAMVRHHQGALEMADRVAVEGSALQVAELAADVSSGQSAEIDRMRELLASM